jgi:hypothetical protein
MSPIALQDKIWSNYIHRVSTKMLSKSPDGILFRDLCIKFVIQFSCMPKNEFCQQLTHSFISNLDALWTSPGETGIDLRADLLVLILSKSNEEDLVSASYLAVSGWLLGSKVRSSFLINILNSITLHTSEQFVNPQVIKVALSELSPKESILQQISKLQLIKTCIEKSIHMDIIFSVLHPIISCLANETHEVHQLCILILKKLRMLLSTHKKSNGHAAGKIKSWQLQGFEQFIYQSTGKLLLNPDLNLGIKATLISAQDEFS